MRRQNRNFPTFNIVPHFLTFNALELLMNMRETCVSSWIDMDGCTVRHWQV